ncbi:DJ-1/PfpI family protein [Caulobacter sp. 17J80-11]|uniref:DJ-1/PfpI family protein n=1 Tax=Caulobacter sp. 17J80-11 TaxID=2763502 RepID=UPI001653D3D4|nr:DJ-1/PfpI family protein [Caulobacter sp. 17J80-11]MBC6981566.1 DJ-1/PfpI family protein [Caulobacter sp. 17J80-11]
MNRREILGVAAGAGALAALAGAAAAGSNILPRREKVRVAFMLGDSTNVIDTAGPWEVFQDTSVTEGGRERNPFELYTVAPTSELVRMTGGLKLKPDYGVADAPQPHVIVVPAQRSTEASREWLKRASAGADLTMSVCTGAFQLARVGLLDGLAATTHHEFWDSFAEKHPNIELRRGARFVDSGRIATAGGLTSGIDLALHVVARYFGEDTAAATARYMEHASDAWRTA